MKLSEILYSTVCETVYVDESDNILSESAVRAFKREGQIIKKMYRCTFGPKEGKIVSEPGDCAKKKNKKRVKAGRIVARTKKGIRICKTAVAKQKAISKLVTRLNQQ